MTAVLPSSPPKGLSLNVMKVPQANQQCDGKSCGTRYLSRGPKWICVHNNLQALYPELCKRWNTELNNDVPSNYTPGSKYIAWWNCENVNCKCKARQCEIKYMVDRNPGCPCCKGQFCPHNNLTTTHSELCKRWNVELNDEPPSNYTLGSHYVAWWNCENTNCKCKVYQCEIHRMTDVGKDPGCPCCKGRLCLHNNLAVTYPELCQQWDPKKSQYSR